MITCLRGGLVDLYLTNKRDNHVVYMLDLRLLLMLICYFDVLIYEKIDLVNGSHGTYKWNMGKISIENVKPIVVVNVYRPPQGSYKKCCEFISSAFDRADLKDNTDIFLMGDFNINYSNTNSPEFKELDFTTRSMGLNQLITSPTRTTFREGVATESTIDIFWNVFGTVTKVSEENGFNGNLGTKQNEWKNCSFRILSYHFIG